MIIIRRIGVVSTGKLAAAVLGGIGLIGGVLLSVFGFLAALLDDSYLSAESIFTMFSLICIMPLVYAVIGLLGGFAAAFLCNLAQRFGGFELQAELSEKPAPVPGPAAKPVKAARKKKTGRPAKTKKNS